ncbi:MAG: cytochrome P450 [Actinobacteria bacterium]|nr:cytochrome P450 [Actinomycetota bacterium]
MTTAMLDPLAHIFADPERVLTDPADFYADLHRGGDGAQQGWGVQLWGYDAVRDALRSPLLTVSPSGTPARSSDPWLAEVIARMPSMTDGPDRDVAIRALRSAFTPRAAGESDDIARSTVAAALINAGAHGGSVDLIGELAAPALPAFLLTALGLEGAIDAAALAAAGRAVTLELLPWADPSTERIEAIRAAHDSLLAFVAAERGNGRLDLLGRLLAAVADDRDAVSTILLLLVGGQETITSLVATSLEFWSGNQATGASLDDVVDESARLTPPIHMLARTALTDLQCGTISIGAGSPVIILLGAALRDPEAFDRPDHAVWNRSSDRGNRAIAFGAGPHQCLGRAYAQLLVTEILRQIDATWSDWRQRERKASGWTAVPVFQGPTSLLLDVADHHPRGTATAAHDPLEDA